MADNFLTGLLGSVGTGLDTFAKRKLELALETQQLKQKLEIENQAKSVPQDQFRASMQALGLPAPEMDVSHPIAQGALYSGAKPLAGISLKSTTAPQKFNNDKELTAAVLQNPELFASLPGHIKARIAPGLSAGGFTYLGQRLSPEMLKTQENAKSGLRALDKITSITQDAATMSKLAVPGSIGARELRAARGEVQDVITRLRTGAALNKDEQAFYDNQLPGLLDLLDAAANGQVDSEALNYKLNLYRPLFEGLSQRQGTATVNRPSSAKGAKGPAPAVHTDLQSAALAELQRRGKK